MTVMKRILLPTDFSENSKNAIEYGVQLYKDVPCKFFVQNVYRIPYLANEELMNQNVNQLESLEEEMHLASQQGMENLLEDIPKNPKHEFETISDYNLFSLAVHQAVEEKDIDLIIMGTKGATGASEIFVGTNTSDVIIRNSCHVIAVPEKHQFKPPKEIVFPTDFRIAYSPEDMIPLIGMAKLNNATIRIVHFSDTNKLDEIQQKNRALFISGLGSIAHEFYTISASGFEEGLNCFTQSRGNIDMIVILGRHYGFFERLFFKPKVKTLSFHTRIPLFVIHHSND